MTPACFGKYACSIRLEGFDIPVTSPLSIITSTVDCRKISYYSGLRLQEILDMQPEHIACDPDTHAITIWIPKGKRDEAREAYLPKTMYGEMQNFTRLR